MIQIKYKALFDIELLHSFYNSGKTGDLQLLPTAACSLLIQRLGLRYIPTNNGGKLFAKVTSSGGLDFMKQPLLPGTCFSFVLHLSNNLFENFTAVSISKPRGQHYYFNNIGNNISAAGSPLLVSDTVTKLVSDADLLPFISNTFSYTHTNVAATQNGVLQFDNGEILEQSLNNQNNIFNFSFDLNKASGGRAKFLIEGVEKLKFYAINTATTSGEYGMVDIFYDTSLNAAYQFQLADNSVETKHYKIAFGNRKTKWRYIISKKYNQAVSAVQVSKTNGSPIAFTAQPGAPAGQSG